MIIAFVYGTVLWKKKTQMVYNLYMIVFTKLVL